MKDEDNSMPLKGFQIIPKSMFTTSSGAETGQMSDTVFKRKLSHLIWLCLEILKNA